jgi:hypothetical protein
MWRIRNVRSRLVLVGGVLLFALQLAHADGTARYSYEQQNLDANLQPLTYSDQVGPEPVPLVADVQTPNSSYHFDVSGLQRSPTSLSARALLSVNADHLQTAELWNSVKADAQADASLVDFASVQGAVGATSGTVVFTWAVSGVSSLTLDTSNFNLVEVRNLSTSVTLASTIPSAPGLLLDDTHTYPNSLSNNEVWQQSFVSDTGALVFDVPWQAGTEMPVFFDLTTKAQLEIVNFDAAGFAAGLDVDMSNTAVLSGVEILDDQGQPVPGARLVSRDGFQYPGVPEPGSGLMLLSGLICFGRRIRRPRAAIQLMPSIRFSESAV